MPGGRSCRRKVNVMVKRKLQYIQQSIGNVKYWEVVDNGIQKRELVVLEAVVETDLEQSYKKNYIVTKFKDTDRNNEESDIEAQTIANMTSRNSKNDVDVSSNVKYVFPNASRANILKQSNVMRGSSNIPVYILPQLASPVVKLVNQIST